tara:strand:- start:9553 stop:10443 length:891 start_codon:yes stop_codon:yes gene_type:complete
MLQLVQQVTAELGLPVPASVAGNTTQDVVQILALMNAGGYELLRKAEWRNLVIPYTFYTSYTTTTGTYSTSSLTMTVPSTAAIDTTYMIVAEGLPNATFISSIDSGTTLTMSQYATTAATSGTVYFQKVKYALPSDYDSIVPRTQWDKSKHWEMLGPETAQQWEWILSGFIATGPRVRWRLLGSYFQIWPGFSNTETLGFEYRSKAWAATTAGVAKNSFTVDTDTCIYPDRLMVLNTKLKYLQAKGFPTEAVYRDYLTELETDIAQNVSGANLSFAPKPGSILIGWDQIPDQGFGQ